MGYDQNSDVLIKLFELKDDDNKSLLISLMSYNNGEPKIQITRSFPKKDGSTGYGKMGRLTKQEFEFILKNSDEILRLMNNQKSS